MSVTYYYAIPGNNSMLKGFLFVTKLSYIIIRHTISCSHVHNFTLTCQLQKYDTYFATSKSFFLSTAIKYIHLTKDIIEFSINKTLCKNSLE